MKLIKNSQPPYSDEKVQGYVVEIKDRMKKNEDILIKCENALTEAGLLNNDKMVGSQALTPSKKQLFEVYETLRNSQYNLQIQLEKFETYLSLRGVQA